VYSKFLYLLPYQSQILISISLEEGNTCCSYSMKDDPDYFCSEPTCQFVRVLSEKWTLAGSSLPDWSFWTREVRLHVLTSARWFFMLGCRTRPSHGTDGRQVSAALTLITWSETPRGSISKQRYRVPAAIRSGAHTKFSTLYVDRDGAKAEGGGLCFNWWTFRTRLFPLWFWRQCLRIWPESVNKEY